MMNKVMSYFGYSKRAATSRDTSGWFVDYVNGGASTLSGERINNNNAMALSTVFACINNISTDISKLPIKVFQKKDGVRREISDHPLRKVLDKQPNPNMTAMDFRQAITAHCLGWGNGYAFITKKLDGSIAFLSPLVPSRTIPKQDEKTKEIYYEVTTESGLKSEIVADNVLHIHGLGYDGLTGYNVIHQARESLGLAKATEKFGASYFGNGTVPGGFLEHPNNLSDAAKASLIQSMEKRHQGAENAHKITVLEEGMKFNQNTIPPEESQFLQTRQFSIPEICRWFRMQPHKVADLTRATFSNIEEQSLEYVTDTLTPWLRRWEQAIWSKLLTEQEQDDGYYVEHIVEGLLRGNIAARYSAYQIAIGNNNNPGFMTVNEIRERENLNPIDEGDELFTPTPGNGTESVPVENETEDAVINDMASRIANVEKDALKASHDKHGGDFSAESFYDKFIPKQCDYIRKTVSAFGIDINPLELIGKTQEEIKELLCSIMYSKA